ncbi:MAG: transposase [Aureispira sp.]
MEKYQNKYRIASTRLPYWDYGWNGAYFITICTKKQKHFFGSVVDGQMQLSAMGHIANSCWYEIPNHFPFVELGAHVIMPNHVHGIVGINKLDGSGGDGRDAKSCVSTIPKNKFGPQSKNMASIIRGFKTGVTKHARKINPDFAWQARYWDHIIRDEPAYQRITQYISNNPQKWQEDRLNGGRGNKVLEPIVPYRKKLV